MYEVFFNKLAEKITLTPQEIELFKTFLIPKKLRRRQYFLQEGDVAKSAAFVEKGMLRSFTVDEKGNEHIAQFAMEGWFISDMYSMLTDEPATHNIEALEDSELLIITKQAQEQIMLHIPKYAHYMLLSLQGAFVALHRRVNEMASLGAEDKYLQLVARYPEIVQRVPQHMIASYLGLTPETLSRARKQLSIKK